MAALSLRAMQVSAGTQKIAYDDHCSLVELVFKTFTKKVRIDLHWTLHEFGAQIRKQFGIGRPILAVRSTGELCVEKGICISVDAQLRNSVSAAICASDVSALFWN